MKEEIKVRKGTRLEDAPIDIRRCIASGKPLAEVNPGPATRSISVFLSHHFRFLLCWSTIASKFIIETVPKKLMPKGNVKIKSLFFDQSNVGKNIDVFFGSAKFMPRKNALKGLDL